MKINHDSFKVNNGTAESRFYVKKGDQEYIDIEENYRVEKDSDIVCAKMVRNKLTKSVRNTTVKDYSYFIRTTPGKQIWNPFQKHTIEKNIEKNYIDLVCKDQTVYSQVTPSVFNKYLEFLKNGSAKKLQDIQREIK